MKNQQDETDAEAVGPPDQVRAGAVAREIAAIRERFGEDWSRDPEALAAASALWQGGHNEHGVFTGGERETVARSPAGLFAFGVDFTGPASGFGRLPSVWGRPFASREEARQAAVEELLERIGPGIGAGVSGQRDREDCRRVREQLRGQLRPRQRGLFD